MRSEKQKQKAKEWGHFVINEQTPVPQEHFEQDIRRSDAKRRAEEVYAEIQRKRALREVWE